jgi:hypothetical protein
MFIHIFQVQCINFSKSNEKSTDKVSKLKSLATSYPFFISPSMLSMHNAAAPTAGTGAAPSRQDTALSELKRRIKEHLVTDQQLKESKASILPILRFHFYYLILSLVLERMALKDLLAEFNQSELDMKALQTVGQMIGEVIKALDEERCKCLFKYPVLSSSLFFL